MKIVTDPLALIETMRAVEQITDTPEGEGIGYIVISIRANDEMECATNSCCRKHLIESLLEVTSRINTAAGPPRTVS